MLLMYLFLIPGIVGGASGFSNLLLFTAATGRSKNLLLKNIQLKINTSKIKCKQQSYQMSLNIIYNTYSESCEAGFGFDIFAFPHSVNSADVSTSFKRKNYFRIRLQFQWSQCLHGSLSAIPIGQQTQENSYCQRSLPNETKG